MDSNSPQEAHRALPARIGAVAGIGFVVLSVTSLGGPFFEQISTPTLLAWVKDNSKSVAISGFTNVLAIMLVAVLVYSLVAISRGRGMLAVVAYAAMAATVAVDWVGAGVHFALADAAKRAGADSGIVALFSLAKMMTFTDGFTFGLAVIAASLLCLRAHALPAPIAWLGLVTGAFHLVSTPIQLTFTGNADGPTGPISVVLALLWVLSASAALLMRRVPAFGGEPSTALSA